MCLTHSQLSGLLLVPTYMARLHPRNQGAVKQQSEPIFLVPTAKREQMDR